MALGLAHFGIGACGNRSSGSPKLRTFATKLGSVYWLSSPVFNPFKVVIKFSSYSKIAFCDSLSPPRGLFGCFYFLNT
jgi:hypothetical protein